MPTILSFRTATIALVPLQSPSRVDKLRRRMTGHPTLSVSFETGCQGMSQLRFHPDYSRQIPNIHSQIPIRDIGTNHRKTLSARPEYRGNSSGSTRISRETVVVLIFLFRLCQRLICI